MENIRKSIIYVDGLRFNLVSMRYRMKKQYEIFPAQSNEKMFEILECFPKFKHKNPDLILLDICMPDIEGFKALKTLKRNIRFREIPVVIASLKQDRKTVLEAMELGAAAFIAKPFSDSYLIERIEPLLNPEIVKSRGDILEEIAANHIRTYGSSYKTEAVS